MMRVLLIIFAFLTILSCWIFLPRKKPPYKGRDLKKVRVMNVITAGVSGMLAVEAFDTNSVDYCLLVCMVLVIINPLIIRLVRKNRAKNN